jgi:hypothetical protein
MLAHQVAKNAHPFFPLVGTGNSADGAYAIHIIVGTFIAAKGTPAILVPFMDAIIATKDTIAVFVVAVAAGLRCVGRHAHPSQHHTARQQKAHKFTKHKNPPSVFIYFIIQNVVQKIYTQMKFFQNFWLTSQKTQIFFTSPLNF